MIAGFPSSLNRRVPDYFLCRSQHTTPSKSQNHSEISHTLRERTMQLKSVRANRNQHYMRSMHIMSSSRHTDAYSYQQYGSTQHPIHNIKNRQIIATSQELDLDYFQQLQQEELIILGAVDGPPLLAISCPFLIQNQITVSEKKDRREAHRQKMALRCQLPSDISNNIVIRGSFKHSD